MQKLRKLNIFEIYKRLPFIIYKSEYLIPQRPFPPTPTQQLASHLHDFPPSLLLDFLLQKPSGKKSQKLQASIKPYDAKKIRQYKASLSQYISFYILPLYKAQKAVVATELYAMENIQEISQLSMGQGTVSKKKISHHFSTLPIETRWPYLQRAGLILEANQIKFEAYQKLFKIPQAKGLKPLALYLQQRKGTKQEKKGEQISLSERQRLVQLSSKMKQKDQSTLTNFVGEYRLTIQQFNIIKRICDQTAKCLDLNKQYLDDQRQYNKKLQSGNTHEAKIIKKSKAIISKKMQKINTFMATVPQHQLNIYHQIFNIPSNPHFKHTDFQQLCKLIQHQKICSVEKKPLETIKIKQQTDIDGQLLEQQQSTLKIQSNQDASVLSQLLTGQINYKTNSTKVKQIYSPIIQAQKLNSAPLQVSSPMEEPLVSVGSIEKIQQEKSGEVASSEYDPSAEDNQQGEVQLKDQNLNDLEILEQDYEVLKLNMLIEKAGKPKIAVKRRIY